MWKAGKMMVAGFQVSSAFVLNAQAPNTDGLAINTGLPLIMGLLGPPGKIDYAHHHTAAPAAAASTTTSY